MFGIATETLLTIGTILLISFVQIVLSLKGKTNEVAKLENKKTKLISKLTNKRNCYIEKAKKEDQKIKELKENETISKTADN